MPDMNSNRLAFSIRVQPHAKRDAVEVSADGTIRVRVTAAPERGKANDAVTKLLAKRLGVSKSSVSITRGNTGRVKTIQIEGMEASKAVQRLRTSV